MVVQGEILYNTDQVLRETIQINTDLRTTASLHTIPVIEVHCDLKAWKILKRKYTLRSTKEGAMQKRNNLALGPNCLRPLPKKYLS